MSKYLATKIQYSILKNYESKLHIREKKILFNEKISSLKQVLDDDTFVVVLNAIKED